MADDTLLEIDSLEAGYGEVQVLWGLSLKARRGALTAIVGANGAGKTTTLRAVAGTIAPWRGKVMFDGEDVTRLPSHAKAERGVALVPEGRQLFGAMSVAENLEMGAYAKRAARKYAARRREVFALFGIERGFERQVDHSEHPVHGSSNLVAHIRQKFALGVIGGVGGLLGEPALLHLLLQSSIHTAERDALQMRFQGKMHE